MLTMQRAQRTSNPSHSTLPGPRMNRALAIILVVAGLAAVFAAIAIFGWYQAPPLASECAGAFNNAQEQALSEAQVFVDGTYYQTGAPQVPISGEAALKVSEAQVDPSASPAPCLSEGLVRVTANTDVVPTFNDMPTTNSPAWMVILQGTGPELDVPASLRDDTVFFIDPFGGDLMGHVNISRSTEQQDSPPR